MTERDKTTGNPIRAEVRHVAGHVGIWSHFSSITEALAWASDHPNIVEVHIGPDGRGLAADNEMLRMLCDRYERYIQLLEGRIGRAKEMLVAPTTIGVEVHHEE